MAVATDFHRTSPQMLQRAILKNSSIKFSVILSLYNSLVKKNNMSDFVFHISFYLNFLSLIALQTTVTELKLIQAAAIIGLSVQPNIP